MRASSNTRRSAPSAPSSNAPALIAISSAPAPPSSARLTPSSTARACASASAAARDSTARDRARRDGPREPPVAERRRARDPSRRRVERARHVLAHHVERPALARHVDSLLERRQLRARPFSTRAHQRRVQRPPPRDVRAVPLEHEARDHRPCPHERQDARRRVRREPLGEERPRAARVDEAARVEHGVHRAHRFQEHSRATARAPLASSRATFASDSAGTSARRSTPSAPSRASSVRSQALALARASDASSASRAATSGRTSASASRASNGVAERAVAHQLVEEPRVQPGPRLHLPPLARPALDVTLAGDDVERAHLVTFAGSASTSSSEPGAYKKE